MPLSATIRTGMAMVLDTLPSVIQVDSFALKGGTAINLFEQPLPRFSVDIDIQYLPQEDTYEEAHKNLSKAMNEIAARVQTNTNYRANRVMPHRLRIVSSHNQNIQIKVETNPITRGHLLETRLMDILVPDTITGNFGVELPTTPVLSRAELYGGKLVAAMSRQNPRDFYDLHKLLESDGGINHEIGAMFLVLALSAPRSIGKLLNPPSDMMTIEQYETLIEPMMIDHASHGDLCKSFNRCKIMVQQQLTPDRQEFLLSFVNLEPNWELFEYPEAQNLPAIRFRLSNLAKAAVEVRNSMVRELESIFEDLPNRVLHH